MMIRRVQLLDKAIGLGRPYTSSGFPARRSTVVSCFVVPQQTSVEIVSLTLVVVAVSYHVRHHKGGETATPVGRSQYYLFALSNQRAPMLSGIAPLACSEKTW